MRSVSNGASPLPEMVRGLYCVFMPKYMTRDHVELEPNEAIDKPIGSEFMIVFQGATSDATVRVLRISDHEWLASQQFGPQATIHQLQDGYFDPHQHGYPAQPTLHDAVRAKFGPF